MHLLHSGHDVQKQMPHLHNKAPVSKSDSEAVIEFLLLPHTSLLDLGRASARPFFWFCGRVLALPR